MTGTMAMEGLSRRVVATKMARALFCRPTSIEIVNWFRVLSRIDLATNQPASMEIKFNIKAGGKSSI